MVALESKVSCPNVVFMYVQESPPNNASVAVVRSRLSATPNVNEQFLTNVPSPPSSNTCNPVAAVAACMNLMFLKEFLVPVFFNT